MNYKDLLTRVLETEVMWLFTKYLNLLIMALLLVNINTAIAQSDNYWWIFR